MSTGESRAKAWIGRSFLLTPLLWIIGGLFWLVPLTSPRAPGHALYVVPLAVWPFLLLLTFGSGCTLLRARRRTAPLSRAQWIALGALQSLLLVVFVLGSIPILTFDLAPDQSMDATAVQTPLGIIAVAALSAEWVLLSRRDAAGRAALTGSR